VLPASADPSVLALVTGVAPAAAASSSEGRPGDGGAPDKTRTWVRTDTFRLRADRVTAIEVSKDGLLLLHTQDHDAPIPLTPPKPTGSGTPAPGLDRPDGLGSLDFRDGLNGLDRLGSLDGLDRLDGLADALLARIETPYAGPGAVLITPSAGLTFTASPLPPAGRRDAAAIE
jgi:hypothetical protein